MKAYMSEAKHGSALHAEWLNHPDFARFSSVALNEARAILAETEPMAPIGFRSDAGHVHTNLLYQGEQAALAEALAAFVAEED